MKLKGTASLALLLSGALALGACTSDAGTTDSTSGDTTAATSEAPAEEGTEGEGEGGEAAEDPTTSEDPCLHELGITESQAGEVKYTAGKPEWTGYNSITADTYSTYNSVISAMMSSGFTYYGTDGSLCLDEGYGTVEVKSEDPLIVEYTIADDAVWSDGTPITINDYLLDWAAQNPEFVAPGFIGGNGEPVFNHVSSSLAEKVPDGPKGEVGGKTFTIEYSSPDPDYMINVGSALPAHVVAEQSGITPEELAQAILDKDAETVKSVADFWNDGWIWNPGELPADLDMAPSSGPYKLKEGGWQAGTSLTLTANENYWGEPPATQEMIFRFLDDAGQAQALQNGDVQVIAPQATVDTVPQLEAMGENIAVYQHSTLTWEHLDYNFREDNVMSDLLVREAFAMCVPRQQIVDNLIKPINPDTVLMNAREVFPFQEDYEAVTAESYDGRYDQVDIEGAKAKLEEAGVSTPVEVRIGYSAGNQRRQETVALIQSVCKDAGFDVKDASSDTFFQTELPNGDYEIALFAWAGSGQITSGQNIYATGRPQNYGEYSSETVDEAYNTLVSTLDEQVHLEQTKIIEKELWDTLYGLPIYAHPGVVGADAALENIRPTSTQSQVSWNAFQWVAAS